VELHQLRYLRATVRTGSVTRAAESELVAQPSISRQLALLERELGTPLFHRVGRRVVPTESGLALAECAARVFDDIAATTTAIAGPASDYSAHLTICATETACDFLLPAAISRLSAERPGLRVTVEMLGTDDAVSRLVADGADFAIVVLPLADSRLEIEPLIEEDVLLAMPRGHALARFERVPLAHALRDDGLLLSMPGHGLRAQVEAEAQSRGIVIQSRIEMRSQQALLALTAAGGGTCFAPRVSSAHRTDIEVRPLDPPLTRRLGWARRRGRRLPRLAEELLAYVRP
jgi:LysR family hydrogen peroxide-inducible transcriptional activator